MLVFWYNIKTGVLVMGYFKIAFLFMLVAVAAALIPSENTDWKEYNGDAARSHYSPLTQINPDNVSKLKVAWTYSSGGADTTGTRTQIQCNPIIIDGILYGVSADIQAFAIDAASGKAIWKTSVTDNNGTLSRGVSYWTDGSDKRIFFGAGKWLYALDVRSGKPVVSFGENGRIDLQVGIERPGGDNYVQPNTPAAIYKNLVVVGARLNEGETALLGDIRSYDAKTGKLLWTFHTIPAPGEPGYETWQPANPRERHGGANAWAGMAIDHERGIIYAPTGSAAHDFYGGNRKGNNLYANCLLALKAETGKLLWHYQLVHHDVWDRDPPSPPNLLTITLNGKKIDVVAQTTKQGHIFVFDRVTGKPIFPIEEKAFPTDGIEGEALSPTQPIPSKPAPFTKQIFTEADVNPWAANRDSIIATLRKARTGTPYMPLTGEMTIFFPGTDGGAQWGGSAVDKSGIMYIPAKQNPCYSSLILKKNKINDNATAGAQLYNLNCAACHGQDRKGSHDGTYPPLAGIESRLTKTQVRQVLQKGRGMMPSFSHLPEKELEAILGFILDDGRKDAKGGMGRESGVLDANTGVPYQHTGYNRWYDSNGYPVSAPPWGTLTAVDLNSGEHLWQVPLGEYPELTAKGIPPTGTDNYGGPLVTESGLIFIAASKDEKFRVLDKRTGKILWEAKLPAAGFSSPSTYSVAGKQYVVIACGGGKLKARSGDRYVAFALP